MVLSLILFFISVVGFVLHRSHALMLLLALELMLLSMTFIVLVSGLAYESNSGQVLGLVFISVAGAESAVGLSILVAYYRLRGQSLSHSNLYITLVLLPFIASLITAVRGRSLGFIGSAIVTTVSTLVGAILAWCSVYEVVLCRSAVSVEAFNWLIVSSDSLSLHWGFMFDDLSVIICAVVFSVSGLVHMFSIDYINGDPHGQRFISLLSLFTAFIILLVTGNSLAIMFVGWERNWSKFFSTYWILDYSCTSF